MSTQRAVSYWDSTLADNTTGNITAGNGRDLAYSVYGYSSTSDPGANDDGANTNSTGYFGIGSRWTNTSTPSHWVCTSGATGAAVWKRVDNTVNDITVTSPLAISGTTTRALSIVTAAPGSSATLTAMPFWIKVTKTYSDFSTAATSNTIEIYSAPASTVLHLVKVKHSTLFSGGTITTYTMSVGITGSTSKYITNFDVKQTVSGTAQTITGSALPGLPDAYSTTATTSVKGTAVCSGGLLNAATQGSCDYWIMLSSTS